MWWCRVFEDRNFTMGKADGRLGRNGHEPSELAQKVAVSQTFASKMSDWQQEFVNCAEIMNNCCFS